MNIQSAYNEWSQSYDSDLNATRDLDRTVLEKTFGKSEFNSIVEAGCGTGKNTELLARLGGKVQALDFSEGMLAKAKEKLGHLPNVTFAVADLTQRWPCADGSANLANCDLVLEHIRDLSPVFAEAARVLVAGGIFYISELHPFRQYDGKVAVFQRGEKTMEIPAFVHHISDFLQGAEVNGFALKKLQEWWHEKDAGKLPRLITFVFERR